MVFEIGDKVLTTAGLYMGGEWRERGHKGKIVDISNEFGGLLTVKFKGIEDPRQLRPEYVILRKKAEAKRPFQEGDTVALTEAVWDSAGSVPSGAWAEVLEVIPDSNLVLIDFDHGGELTVAEDILTKIEATTGPSFPESYSHPDRWKCEDEEESVPDLHEVKDNPEVQAALALILERIEEIKALLTTQPKSEVVFNIHPANGLTEEQVEEALREEPAPEPIFKKAKEVVAGDLLYTEAGAYDKVDRIDTKASGYTSLYGVFGNQIAQVPSGRVVQVLEEVS